MVVVRFLLFLALSAIIGAALMYLWQRDRRYLLFIGQVIRFTLLILGAVLVFFLLERLVLVV